MNMDMGLMLMLKSVSEKGGEHKHAGDVENPLSSMSESLRRQ